MIRNMKGVHCQTSTSAMTGMASAVFDKKSVRENPNNEMSQLRTPDSVLSMKRQNNRAENSDTRHVAAEDEGESEAQKQFQPDRDDHELHRDPERIPEIGTLQDEQKVAQPHESG